MELTRITRKYAYLTLAAVDADGAPVTPAAVAVALLRVNQTPTAATTWTTVTATDGRYRMLLAGPDAEPDGALVVQRTSDLWARSTDTPEVDAAKIGPIELV